MTTRPVKRTRYVNEPAYIEVDGETRPYVPINITKAREAYAASLDVIFKHVADFHVTIVQIISEKYKINEDEIIDTIKSNPRYTNMYKDPNLNPLGYFKEDAVTAVTDKDVVFDDSDVDNITTKVAEITMAPVLVKKKITVRRPKKTVA